MNISNINIYKKLSISKVFYLIEGRQFLYLYYLILSSINLILTASCPTSICRFFSLFFIFNAILLIFIFRLSNSKFKISISSVVENSKFPRIIFSDFKFFIRKFVNINLTSFFNKNIIKHNSINFLTFNIKIITFYSTKIY